MYCFVAKSGLARNRSWVLGKEPLVIGRGEECGVVVGDPTVSRQHCCVYVEGGQLRFRHLGSKNPTQVNGKSLQSGVLRPGDEVRIGLAQFEVQVHRDGQLPGVSADAVTQEETLACREYDFNAFEDGLSKSKGNPAETADELSALLRAHERFDTAPTVRDLLDALGGEVHTRLEPTQCWFAERDAAGGLTWLPLGDTDAESPYDSMVQVAERALSEVMSLAVPERSSQTGRSSVSFTAAVPVHAAGNILGALALCVPLSECMVDEAELHFLTSLAYAAAPRLVLLTRLADLNDDMRDAEGYRLGTPPLIGSSQPMAELRKEVDRIAPTGYPVLLVGETGSGKEVVASWLHARSTRRQGPFTVLNCAAIPKELFESEVFGHEKGAFTGAAGRREGLLKATNGGTLFMDEASELSPDNQVRILRAIETKSFRPVGSNKEVQADFRLIAACNSDLLEAVETGRFRRDLYHRLRGVEIRIPPLRDRGEDVLELAEYFLKRAREQCKHPLRGFSEDAVEFLMACRWPGNVRELRHGIEAAALFSSSEYITAEALRRAVHEPVSVQAPLPMAEVERRHILRAIDYCGGKVADAARMLGLSKSYVYKRLAEYRTEGG